MTPRFSLFAALCAVAFPSFVSAQDDVGSNVSAVVYGQDDRTDVYAHADAELRDLARESIVVMFGTPLTPTDGVATVPASPTLSSGFGVCEDQRFADQPIWGDCSGTLIAPDLVLTAGHCVETQRECEGVQFAFDYFYTSEGTLEQIDTDDLYDCAELVVQRNNGAGDFAVVRLDRAVVGRTPAAVLPAPSYDVDTPLSMIGFGSGLPAKIDDGGAITRAPSSGPVFFGSVDAFGGNSGSGVFNEDEELIGVLVAGAEDYVDRDGCSVPNELANSEGQEEITRIDVILAAYCGTSGADATLCAGVEGEDGGPNGSTASAVGTPKSGCSCDATDGAASSALWSTLLILGAFAMAWRRARIA